MRLAALLIALLPLYAQNGPPRSKASDYPAHVSLAGMEIGAEYLVHSIPGESGFYFAKEYLVVDVGVFSTTHEGVAVKNDQFSLRINDGKLVLSPASPGTVAGALKYPDWENQRAATVQAGPVIYGTPSPEGRFPGDQRAPPPVPRPVEDPPNPSGTEARPARTIDESIAGIALSEGPNNKTAKGCLFFRFSGKMKSIRSLDLVYDGGDGRAKATIPLF
ncbi:MAG TPA: hypothetical protein VGP62_22215 [Bryobacteraceae bacterium]|nr:hypothetical protein [Bryobacteraceae bacterium]